MVDLPSRETHPGRRLGTPQKRLLETAERFRRARQRTGLTVNATGHALCVTPRTIRNWEAGRTRAPAIAIKLLRTLYGGRLHDPAWADWRLWHGRLFPPSGNNSYAPWEIEQLEAIFRQAAHFRTLYDQLHERPHLTPPTVLPTLSAKATPHSPTKAEQPGPL
jgi:DNA-binding transcriptional regulator YiaG